MSQREIEYEISSSSRLILFELRTHILYDYTTLPVRAIYVSSALPGRYESPTSTGSSISTISNILLSLVNHCIMGSTYNLEELVATDIQTVLPAEAVAEIISQAPFTTVPGILNLRDISNATIPTSPSPAVLRPGLAYRSAAPVATFTPDGLTALNALGIKKIYDLRRPDERTKKPSPVIDGVEVVWIPDTLGGKPPNSATAPPPDPEKSTEALVQMYTTYLTSHAPVYKAVFEHIRDEPEKPFLFHCSGLSYPTTK